MPTYQWVSFVNHSDPSGDWQDPAKAYDGDWTSRWYGDIAWNVSFYAGWTNFLELILAAAIWIDKIRFSYGHSFANKKIDIDVYNSELGVWQHVIEQFLVYGTQHTASLPSTRTDRVRVRIDNTGPEAYLYEVDVRQVIPDTPEPPPNPPEVYQTIMKTQETNKTQGEVTRMRMLHRTTMIKPWVV